MGLYWERSYRLRAFGKLGSGVGDEEINGEPATPLTSDSYGTTLFPL